MNVTETDNFWRSKSVQGTFTWIFAGLASVMFAGLVKIADVAYGAESSLHVEKNRIDNLIETLKEIKNDVKEIRHNQERTTK